MCQEMHYQKSSMWHKGMNDKDKISRFLAGSFSVLSTHEGRPTAKGQLISAKYLPD